jgi:hypothetical protein
VREAARKHKKERLDKMERSARAFSAQFGLSADAVLPPPKKPASAVPAVAQSDEEQVSRMEAPVCCVRWHPTHALLASAANSVVLWAPPTR